MNTTTAPAPYTARELHELLLKASAEYGAAVAAGNHILAAEKKSEHQALRREYAATVGI